MTDPFLTKHKKFFYVLWTLGAVFFCLLIISSSFGEERIAKHFFGLQPAIEGSEAAVTPPAIRQNENIYDVFAKEDIAKDSLNAKRNNMSLEAYRGRREKARKIFEVLEISPRMVLAVFILVALFIFIRYLGERPVILKSLSSAIDESLKPTTLKLLKFIKDVASSKDALIKIALILGSIYLLLLILSKLKII